MAFARLLKLTTESAEKTEKWTRKSGIKEVTYDVTKTREELIAHLASEFAHASGDLARDGYDLRDLAVRLNV